MATTIQVDDDIKKKLFHLKIKLSEQEGKNISYNEIIARLLQNSKLTLKKQVKNREKLRKYCGILPKNTLQQWQNEKYDDFA